MGGDIIGGDIIGGGDSWVAGTSFLEYVDEGDDGHGD